MPEKKIVRSDHHHLQSVAVVVSFRPKTEMCHEQRIDYYEAPSSLLSNASRIVKFGQRCEELWKNLSTLRVLKFLGTKRIAGVKQA